MGQIYLPPNRPIRMHLYQSNPVEYHIDMVYKNIKGVGLVVGGNLITGTLKIGDKLLSIPCHIFLGILMTKRSPNKRTNW